MRSSATTSWENRTVIGVFIAALAFFLVASVYSCFATTEVVCNQEERLLASFPRLHSLRKDLAQFPPGFESFFNDRFFARLNIISLRNYLILGILHSSGNSQCALGRDGWIFYSMPHMIRAQQNPEPFSALKLRQATAVFQARRDFLAEHGIKYLLVLVPEKGTIYPELMPAGWVRRCGQSRLEQLQASLKKSTNVEFVDAQAVLLAEKPKGRVLYHSNDSHWNDYGAFLVAQEILVHLEKTFAAVHPFKADDYVLSRGRWEGDLAKLLGLQNIILDTTSPKVSLCRPHAVKNLQAKLPAIGDNTNSLYEQDAAALPRGLFLHDSFTYFLQPYLAEVFRSSEFHICHEMVPDVILAQHPDVVVEEIAERHLIDRELENVPLFLQLAKDKPAEKICSFGKDLELVEVEAVPSDGGVAVNLIWHAKKAMKLDKLVCVHAFDPTAKQELGVVGYVQDFLKRDVEAGQYWSDRVEVTDRKALCAQQVGIVVTAPDGTPQVCDGLHNLYSVCQLWPVSLVFVGPDPFGSSFVAVSKQNQAAKM